jgi:Fe-S-cluster-containing hydrogenase component 2
MPNIANILNILEKIESPAVGVHQERCVLVRNRNASCRRCSDACVSGAISCAEDKLDIIPDLCIGCGTCATVCPTGALEAKNPPDKILFANGLAATKATKGAPVIACSTYLDSYRAPYERDAIVETKCLGRLEESFLVGLVANGAKMVTLVSGDCTQCPYGNGLDTARLVCDTATVLMEACGHADASFVFAEKLPSHVCLASTDPKHAQGLSRREFFSQMKQSTRTAAASAVTGIADGQSKNPQGSPRYVHVREDGSLPHFIPTRREKLLDWLSLLGYPEEGDIPTRLWGHVSIDTHLCTACMMCANFCPTEALVKYKEEDGSVGIDHYPSRCVHCCLCRDICLCRAITVDEEVPALALAEVTGERYEMKVPDEPKAGTNPMYNKLSSMLGKDQVYER